MTVSSTRNETKADRAHHLSKVEQTIVLREQKEAQKELPKLTKKEQRRDRSQRKDEKEDPDQKDHLKKEEEAADIVREDKHHAPGVSSGT